VAEFVDEKTLLNKRRKSCRIELQNIKDRERNPRKDGLLKFQRAKLL